MAYAKSRDAGPAGKRRICYDSCYGAHGFRIGAIADRVGVGCPPSRASLEGGKAIFQLTFAGWSKYAELRHKRTESRTAFMAMKFGQADLDRVVNECFRPAVARTGYELRLVTDQQPAGIIDDQMRAAILASRFVIADLTHGSPGAYWEAGFGEGLGLPVIYTCEQGAWEKSKTHFDTNHMVTILWDAADLKKAENNLVATIRATLRAEATQADD